MPLVRMLHSGGIQQGRETLHLVNKGSRPDVIMALNDWLFDWRYSRNQTPTPLPPLDDWTQSHDDPSMWCVIYPDNEFAIWIKTDIIEFK